MHPDWEAKPVDVADRIDPAVRDTRHLWSAWVEIDLDAVADNVKSIQTVVGPACRIIAVVKANAYGHGAVGVAKAALEAGAQAIGVAVLEEALTLRRAGVRAPIYLLGAVPPEQIPLVADADLVVSVGDELTARNLAAVKRGWPLRVQVEIDTGLSRFGVPWEYAPSLLSCVLSLPGLVLEGVYTHFATAEDPDDPFTAEQLRRFLKATRLIETLSPPRPIRHVAGSSATLQWPESRLDAVRPGLLILGIYPSARLHQSIPVRPIKKLWARIARCVTVAPGTPVGYGHSYVTPVEQTLATILLGFGCGYPRQLANRGTARVKDRFCPVVGSIALNHLTLNVTGVPRIKPGEAVEMIGTVREGSNTIEALAATAEVPVDVICLAGHGLPHVYLRNGRLVDPLSHSRGTRPVEQ